MTEIRNFDRLLPEAAQLLSDLTDNFPELKNFVMAGGSGLALHLDHRHSEDLDFFTYSDFPDQKIILDFVKKFPDRQIILKTPQQLDLLINRVKLTFFNSCWDFLRPSVPSRFNLASVENIAAMKVNALFLRAKFRDYYDLYFIARQMDLKEIFDHSRRIMEDLTFRLFATALIFTDDIEDDSIAHLHPSENISKKEIRQFFQEKLKMGSGLAS